MCVLKKTSRKPFLSGEGGGGGGGYVMATTTYSAVAAHAALAPASILNPQSSSALLFTYSRSRTHSPNVLSLK